MKKQQSKSAVAKSKSSTKKTVERAAPAKVKPAIDNIDFYREHLESMREDLLKTVGRKKEEVLPDSEGGDEGDVAMRSLARDLVFEQTDNERHLLDEVEAALRRIEKGVYGICEGNGEAIAAARIKAMPYARYCIKCQARFENH